MPPKISQWEVFRVTIRQIGESAGYVLIFSLVIWSVFKGGEKFLGLSAPTAPSDQALLQSFIGWYAAVYTLILTLIVGQGWNRYLRVNNEIDREADALSLLARTSEMCGSNPKDQGISDALVAVVSQYVAEVKSLMALDQRLGGSTEKKMKQIHVCVEHLITQTEIEDCVKSELLKHYCDAYDARSDRFDILDEALPDSVWHMLIIASLIWLFGFFWIDFKSSCLEIFVTVSILGSVSYLYRLARDFDDLRSGYFRANFASFQLNIFGNEPMSENQKRGEQQ